MKKGTVLYTGFKGENNSSYQLISKISGEKLFLTNSFEGLKRDIDNLTDNYDLVIMFGLDKNIKEMVRIERVAEDNGTQKTTGINCDALCEYMAEGHVPCVVSEVPTKYLCNAAYYHMLEKFPGKAVFIHIPSSKNMSEQMMESVRKVLRRFECF